MSSILLTSFSDKSSNIVAWDCQGGNPIAALSGEEVTKDSLIYCPDGRIISAVDKKPLVQYWNFNSSSCSMKKLTTKGIVNCIIPFLEGEYLILTVDKEIIMYQSSSGCIIANLHNSHGARITDLAVANGAGYFPPLLLSSDLDGMLCCWNLAYLNCDSSLENDNDKAYKPFWFIVKANKYPSKSVFGKYNYIYSVSSEGLKVFDPMTGTLMGQFFNDINGIFAIGNLPHLDIIYCGGQDGQLLEIHPTFENLSCSIAHNVRRCFVSYNHNANQKNITHIALSSSDFTLLVVGSKSGLIEVLRKDSAFLTRIQSFNALPPGINSSTSIQLSNLLFIPRPQWADLKIGSSQSDHSNQLYSDDQSGKDRRRGPNMEPFKRHIGWKPNDLVYVKLNEQSCITNKLEPWNEKLLYGDEFGTAADFEATSHGIWLDVSSSEMKDSCQLETSILNSKKNKTSLVQDNEEVLTSNSDEILQLRNRVAELERKNKCLLKRIIIEQTHF